MTLIEVVLAVVLLGIVAVAATGIITTASRLQADNYQRLAAHELASTLIIQFLDDKDAMPSPHLPLEYGPYLFRWELVEEPARMRQKVTESVARSIGQVSQGRFRRIVVRVWIVPPGSDERFMPAGDELALLTRIYDPLAMMTRNPDSGERLVRSPDGLRRFLEFFSQGGDVPTQLDQALQAEEQASTPRGRTGRDRAQDRDRDRDRGSRTRGRGSDRDRDSTGGRNRGGSNR